MITVDGTAGSGKGVLCDRLASTLSWNRLDSGLLYRIAGYLAVVHELDPDNGPAVGELLKKNVRFLFGDSSSETSNTNSAETLHNVAFTTVANHQIAVFVDDNDVTNTLREDKASAASSHVARQPAVRKALVPLQRLFRREPGLIADGRDMGTVVFVDADLKIYLDASLDERAQRRKKQLQLSLADSTGSDARTEIDIEDVRISLQRRDALDEKRDIAPLRPADDAVRIDNTHLTKDEVFKVVMDLAHERRLY